MSTIVSVGSSSSSWAVAWAAPLCFLGPLGGGKSVRQPVACSSHPGPALADFSSQGLNGPGWLPLQVLAEMLELAQGFQDTTYATNAEVFVVFLVAVCLILSVVQVLGVMGIFGKFVKPKGAGLVGAALGKLVTLAHGPQPS